MLGVLFLALAPNLGFSCAPPLCSQPAAPPLAAASCASSNSVDAASGWRAHAAVPRDHPPCRSRCSAANPMGLLLMGKASACARNRGPLLSCSFAASESWPLSWSREARPPSGPPGTVPARQVTSVAELRHGPRPGLPPPRERWVTARLPAYPVRLRRFR